MPNTIRFPIPPFLSLPIAIAIALPLTSCFDSDEVIFDDPDHCEQIDEANDESDGPESEPSQSEFDPCADAASFEDPLDAPTRPAIGEQALHGLEEF